MDASIIIVTHNSGADIDRCLRALLAQSGASFDVIVVDNASTDATREVVGRFGAPVALLAQAENRGFAGGNNIGAAACDGNLVILLNPDTEVQAGWLRALVELFAASPDIAVAGCKGLYGDGRTLQHVGGYIDTEAGHAYHFGDGTQDTGQFDTRREVDFVSGFAFAVRREMWRALGGLDEGYYPAYFEEIDFCYRARRRGGRVVVEPAARVTHFQQPRGPTTTFDGQTPQRHRWRFFLRHLSGDQLLAVLRAERGFIATQVAPQALAGLVKVYIETACSWRDTVAARLTDSDLGGPLDPDRAIAIAQGLRALPAAALAHLRALGDERLTQVRANLVALDTPEHWPELEISGNRLRDRLARWLLKPYVDQMLARLTASRLARERIMLDSLNRAWQAIEYGEDSQNAAWRLAEFLSTKMMERGKE